MLRRLGLLLGALLAGWFALSLAAAGPALAHATLVTSDPADGSRLEAAPRTVTLTFDESVGLGGVGYLHITDQTGRRVDAGRAVHPGGDGTKVADTLQDGLGDGTYTASFRVVSADSHPVAGTIRFVVGNGPLVRGSVTSGGTVDAVTGDAFDVARWISYAGLALLGGGWLVLTIWQAGRDDARARRVMGAGWAALAAGAALELLMQGPYTAGAGLSKIADATLIDDTLHTAYGRLHSVRLVLLGMLALVLVRAVRDIRVARWQLAAAAVLGGGILFTFSGAGHAATTSPEWLSVPIDMAHLLAMATWIGGLVLLAVAVFPRRDVTELGAVLPRFSSVAFVAVCVLVATGTYSALRGIGTVDAVFDTTYGWVVVCKVALLAGILLVANTARQRVRGPAFAYAMAGAGAPDAAPDTAAAAAPDTDADEAATPDAGLTTERIRRAVVVEAVVGLVVLGFSAVLVAQPRGEEALLASYREPITATAPLDAQRHLVVTASPGTHGPVTITVQISDGSTPKSITVTATQPDKEIGPLPIKLTREGAGLYDGSIELPVAGSWELDFTVTTSTFDSTTTDTTITLH